VLPQLVKVFVDSRRRIKQLMKNNDLPEPIRKQYDIEQLALKLTANSMYGCLGSSMSRFHAMPLATYITSKGRQILQETVDMAIKDGIDVIYGDTDSIMINTSCLDISDARKVGEMIKKTINEKYKLLEIDIDKYYKHTLLLQKKKYAGLAVEVDQHYSGDILNEVIDVKGLDLVRRDWCGLSQKVSK
jgi:DNA polymerase alpha subunit A